MQLIRSAAVLSAVCLCVTPVCAQRDPCQQRMIPVSIGTTNGAPAPSLDSAAFEGTYKRKPIRVTSSVMNPDPPRVVLLLDTSGSIHGNTSAFEMNFSVDLAEDLASHMPPASEIGLGFFYKDLVPVSLPNTDRHALKNQLDALHSHPESFKGKTALWDAVLGGLKMFDHPHLGDAIYVITDGGDNASKNTMNQVAQTLGEAGVRLFAFVFENGPENPVRVAIESGPEYLQQVVDDTGGTIVFQRGEIIGDLPQLHDRALFDKSGKPTGLGVSVGSQFRQISSFYRVSIELPETVDKPREWKLDLAGSSKSQLSKVVLAYPHLLVPCH